MAQGKPIEPFFGLQLDEPDDLCDACGKATATRECGHGILCPKCDKEVHGEVNGDCDNGQI